MSIVQCRYGEFTLPNDPDLILDSMRLYGEWAQHEVNFLARIIQPGTVVIDVGSFIGTHARAFSRMIGDIGKVHAFEPNPSSYSLLIGNVNLAACDNIKVYNAGLGASQDTGFVLAGQDGENAGGTKICATTSEAGSATLCLRRLDDYDFGRVDFIKADIEGMEYSMLLGAENVIARDQPLIFLEANNVEATFPIIAWASTRDYVALGVVFPAFNSANFNESTENIFGSAAECGLLMVPKKNLSAIQEKIFGIEVYRIETLDGLSVLLKCKPQYLAEAVDQNLVPAALARKATKGANNDRHDLKAQCITMENAKRKAEEWAHSHAATIDTLHAQLDAMEQAKVKAEEWAHSHAATIDTLNAQLDAMEQAKAKAEEWAHSHAATIDTLDAQLDAMEQAKAKAEEWAHSHAADVARLQAHATRVDGELDLVKSSRAYKLLASLRLNPDRRNGDA